MLCQYLRAPRKTSPFCLYFDPVDDYVAMPDSTFYDFGTNDFTLWVRVHLVDSNLDPYTTTTQDLVGKRESDILKYALGITSNRALFTLSNSGGAGGVNVLTDAVLPLGRFVDVVFRRNGGSPAGNLQSANYQIFFDGVLQTVTYPGSAATLTNANATFAAPFTFQYGGTGASNIYIRKHMFMSGAGCWSRALSDQEIRAVTAGTPPAEGGRGLWPFSHTSGQIVADFSSVQKTGTLFGRSDVEAGVPDPATNRIWLPEEGVFELASFRPTVSRIIAKPHSATGFLAVGIFPNPVTWTLTAPGGAVKATGTLPAKATTAALYTAATVPVASGDTLAFATSGISNTANCAVGIFWPAVEPTGTVTPPTPGNGTYPATYTSTY